MKRVLWVAGIVLVVVAIAAALLLPRFLNPERYRPRLQAMLAQATGRDVVIGPLSLRVFPLPGITAEGFTLGEDPAFGKEPFLSAGRIDARVRLMPLLSSRLDVVSFDVEKPVAHLHRDASGRWNLVSLIEKNADTGAPAGAPAAGSGGGFAITIERFRLVDGTVDITDAAITPGTTHRIEGRSIQLTLSNLSMSSPIGIDLTLGLSGSGKGTLEGTIGPPPAAGGGWPIDAHLAITDFIGGAAAPYLATYTGLRLAGGALDLDAVVKGTAPQSIELQGKVVLKKLRVAPFGGGKAAGAPIDGSVSVDATFAPQETTIRRADVRLGGASLALGGSLADLTGRPTIALRAVAPRVAWKDVAPLLALAGPFVPPGLADTGQISLDATVRGPLDTPAKLALEGSATISGFAFSDPSLEEPIRDIAATLALKGDRAELTGLAASLGKSRVTGACTISRFDRPVIDVDLRAPILDVDEILSFLPAGGGAAAPAPAAASEAGTAPSMLRTVTVRGTLAVDAVKAMNLKLTGARAGLDVTNGEARLHDVAATLYGGTLAGNVTAGLVEAGPPYTLSAKVSGVDFNALCTDFSKDLAGLLYGTLDAALDVGGRGLDTPALRKNLTGTASLALRKGKLTSFGFLKQLSAVLTAAGGRGIGQDETPFDALTGTFVIKDGRATTEDLHLASPDLDIAGKGSVGLDQSIAMSVGVLLSEAVSKDMAAKTPALRNLFNGKGRLAVDVKVGGTLQKPSIGADPDMLKRAAQESLKKKGQDVLKQLLERKKP